MKSEAYKLHMEKPDAGQYHPDGNGLVFANFEEHHGSYIMTINGRDGSLLMSQDDFNKFDTFIRDNLFGYVSDEYESLLKPEEG